MYSIFVTINIKRGHIEEFKEASLLDAQGATRDEPGCFRFDMHQDTEIPERFYLYEVYLDEQAFEAHLETPHFKEWKQTVSRFFDGDIQKVVMTSIFPSEDGWKTQQPGLLNW